MSKTSNGTVDSFSHVTGNATLSDFQGYFESRLQNQSQGSFPLLPESVIRDALKWLNRKLSRDLGSGHYEFSVWIDPEQPRILAYYDSAGNYRPKTDQDRARDPLFYRQRKYEVVHLLDHPSPEVLYLTRRDSSNYIYSTPSRRKEVKSTFLHCFDLARPAALVVTADTSTRLKKGRVSEELIRVVGLAIRSDIALSDLANTNSAAATVGQASRTMVNDHFDVAVVCALRDPELAALRSIGTWTDVASDRGDPTSYIQTSFETAKGNVIRVVAAATTQMGMPASATLATKVLLRFRPRLLAMVGIAAGARAQEQGFGDILAADKTFDYGAGKLTATNDEVRFAPSHEPVPIDPRLLDRLQEWRSKMQGELDAIRTSCVMATPNTVLKLHIGPLASGAAVLSAKGKTVNPAVKEIVGHWRKLVGIEMEAYGVHVASRSVAPQPMFLCVKSACDFVTAKDDKFQPYAAFTAAQFFHRFVVKEWENLHLDAPALDV